MYRKLISLLSLCDLSKAFDSVNHCILLNKCAELKVDPFWFTSYLASRTHSVKLDNIISGEANVRFGIPQGSILGPLLFNIYVNDISDYITDCILIQYADDTQVLHQGYLKDLHVIIKLAERTLKISRLIFSIMV